MARYDSEGYRMLPGIDSAPRRQVLGYSRAVQGGADEARARANQRIAEGRNPSLRFAAARARNVAMSKQAGTFDAIREAYNQNGQNPYQMDFQGNISKGVNVGAGADRKYSDGPAKPKPARATPMSYARPASQRVADVVASTTGQGLLDMARKARRKGTYVIQ